MKITLHFKNGQLSEYSGIRHLATIGPLLDMDAREMDGGALYYDDSMVAAVIIEPEEGELRDGQ